MSAKRSLRCAVYTRKSTEEGLDKEFNSLHAQRDACAAYIRSQAGEGWKVLNHHYDDGGFTGANMERPALQRLLADIDRGLVDVVVVYKIDRLTRSLADFAKIVERFDARGVSFVSITQSFNTTTSMGRLTLNVLLSFAQFEREVTAERIRDKIAASRAKGMWMGGGVPLGYDVRARKLVINESEAKTVRLIFRRYLELGSIGDLREELDRKGVTTKARVSAKGRRSGGGRWYVGPLQHLLRNRVYVGDTVHKGKVYPGEHKPLIARDLFERVQLKLDASRTSWKRKRTVEASGLLTSLIKDDRGNTMTPQWSVGRGGKPHLYYVSQAYLQRRRGEAGSLARAPAVVVEDLVAQCWRALVGGNQEPMPTGLQDTPSRSIRTHVRAVVIGKRQTVITFDASAVPPGILTRKIRLPFDASVERSEADVIVTVRKSLRQRGGPMSVEGWNATDWSTEARKPDPRLVKALILGHRLRAAVEHGGVRTIDDLGARFGLNRNDARNLLRLSLLAPDVQSAIANGQQPRETSVKIIIGLDLPAPWNTQRRTLGM